jgi:hypothetical protein
LTISCAWSGLGIIYAVLCYTAHLLCKRRFLDLSRNPFWKFENGAYTSAHERTQSNVCITTENKPCHNLATGRNDTVCSI